MEGKTEAGEWRGRRRQGNRGEVRGRGMEGKTEGEEWEGTNGKDQTQYDCM